MSGVGVVSRKGEASTIVYPISYSEIRRNGGTTTMDDVRHLEGEEENIHVQTTKPFFSVLLAIIIVNIVTLMALLSLIPVLMNTRWSSFKSAFWVANAYVHTPTDITKQYLNIGRSSIKNKIDKHAKEQTATLLADIFVPSFVCGTILATTLFLVIPEALLLIQRGTSSEEGEIEILSGTISRFGAAVMTGYMLPLVLEAIFPRSPECFNTNSNTDECVSSSDLPVVGIHMRERQQENIDEEEKREENSRTILGSKIRMPVLMPPVFERLSRTETVSFLHQKWSKFYPVRTLNKSTSAEIPAEELMIDNNSEVKDDGTVGSKTNNTICATSNSCGELMTDGDTNINEMRSSFDEESGSENKITNTISNPSISGELTIDDNVEIHDLALKERSTFDSKTTNPISDTSTGEDSNAKTDAKEYDKVNFRLATSIFVSDIAHNFFDGIFIGVAFKTCSHTAAVLVTMITIYKEISHEVTGYFLLTKYAGVSIPRAVLLIFISDIYVVVGGMMILSINQGELAIGVFLAIASGVYLHISASECQPRVYSVVKVSRDRWFSLLFFVTGALPVGLTLLSHRHCNE